jgi:hypothetical protein
MSERIYETEDSFEVSGDGYSVDLWHAPIGLRVAVSDDRENYFFITAEEATAMKNFLIKQGY